MFQVTWNTDYFILLFKWSQNFYMTFALEMHASLANHLHVAFITSVSLYTCL